jgi:DHA1 family bicyclomycin/chloramphenicol resistance-like MFS transporter
MTPLGHIAGTGSAVVGSLSTFISVPLAIAIGRGYDGTVLPLFAGFSMLSFVSLIIIAWVGTKESPSDQDPTI